MYSLFVVRCRYVYCLLTCIRRSGYVHCVQKLGELLQNA